MAKNLFGRLVMAAATTLMMCLVTSCNDSDSFGAKTSAVTDTKINIVPSENEDTIEFKVTVDINGNPHQFSARLVQSWSKTNYKVSDFSDEMSEISFSGGNATATLVADNNVLSSRFTSESKTIGSNTYRLVMTSVQEGAPACWDTELYSANDSTSVRTSGQRKYNFVVSENGVLLTSVSGAQKENVVKTSNFVRYSTNGSTPDPDDPTITWDNTSSFTTGSATSTGSFLFIKKENGQEVDRINKAATGPHTLKVLSSWSATEKNYNQSTSSVVIKSRTSQDVKSGDITYTVTTTVYTTTVSLNGSTQTNTYESVTSSNFRCTAPDGTEMVATAAAEVVTADGGRVNGGSYGNIVTKTFNGTTQTVTGPGRITIVTTPHKGDLDGQYKSSGVCAVVYGSDWRYGVAITTTAGTKVYAINRDGSLVEGKWYSGDTYGYNCSFELNGTLVPCLAKNGSGKLIWADKSGKAYQTITDSAWQFRKGTNNGNTVFTDDYSIKVTKKDNYNVIQIVSASGKVLKTLTDTSK